MMDMGYPIHLIDLLAKLYQKQLANVKVAGTLSEWFRVKKGVRQGCVLSPYLCMILVRTIPCLSPKLAYGNSTLLPFAKTVCVSVRKNSVDDFER